MNADLSQIKAADEPRRFLNAAVLSPDDPAMDASDDALGVLEAEVGQLHRKGGTMGLGTSRDVQRRARMDRIDRAIATIKAKRKAKR